jgi:molybdopterin/thiamine biosynthesis adenylyltransferase
MAASSGTATRMNDAPVAANGRYARQGLISWWRQDRLAQAKVLVVGAGALGNELVKNLALAGVGTVVVIDMDHVENSNLSRCVFFRPRDEGREKAEVVCERARDLNEEVTFIPIVDKVQLGLGLGDFVEFDAVLGGLDNREARLHVNQACWKTSTPYIDGAIEGLMGMMRVFLPPDSACYECTMSALDFRLLSARKTCALLSREEMLDGKVPTTGTSGSVVAAMQVQEMIKLLHRDELQGGYEFGGRGFAYNGMTHDSYVVTYPRREECMSHDTYELEGATRLPADTPFAEVLERGREALGSDDAVLVLEHDVVMNAACDGCGSAFDVLRPAAALHASLLRCETCGGTRRLDPRHTLVEPEHLALSAQSLGLPPNDVVTVETGTDRVHYLLGTPVLSREHRNHT